MKIIEYTDAYLEDMKDLLVELEEYILKIDKDNLDRIHPEYREKMLLLDLNTIKENQSKAYLAVQNNKAIGLIMGFVRKYDEYDYVDYKCPKAGVISELIVRKDSRTKGVGKMLMDKIEKYFKSIECEYVFVDCFAYNEKGRLFYEKMGYHPRMITNIKKLNS